MSMLNDRYVSNFQDLTSRLAALMVSDPVDIKKVLSGHDFDKSKMTFKGFGEEMVGESLVVAGGEKGWCASLVIR